MRSLFCVYDPLIELFCYAYKTDSEKYAEKCYKEQ